jgi:HAE1 family hydrophobic/amphiphilic exporter-1
VAFNLSGTALRDYQRGEDLIPLRVRFAAPRDPRGNPHDPEISDVGEIRIPSQGGGAVSAKAVTATSGLASAGVGEIRRLNRQTTLRVVGTTSTEDLERIRAEVNNQVSTVKFPPGYSREYSGRFADFARSQGEMFSALAWSMVMVLLLMCFLFESVLKPVCILIVSVPGAILGGWGMLLVTGTPNDNLSWLGLIILVGVVVNNGIVQVDLINRLRHDGVERTAAVIEGCSQRLRPILMTTLTTVFGLIPMAVGDASFVGTPYYPMGRMVLGGMLASMVYTLLFVPLLYLILDDVGATVKGWAATVFGASPRGGGQVAVARSPE